MKRNISKTAADFMEWLHELLASHKYVLLHRREHEKADELGDKLLGYYDDKGVYIIPDKVFGLAEDFMTEHSTDIVSVETDLMFAEIIRPEYDGIKLRFRKQKRIGESKKRYLTFERRWFENNDELTEIINCR